MSAVRTASGQGSLKPYARGALVLVVLGLLCLLVVLQSSSLIFWTGERVQGTNEAGIIYYEVDGQQRTMNDPSEPPTQPRAVTVYADASDSTKDRVAQPVKWFDASFVAIPFLAAGIVLMVGINKRRTFRLRAKAAQRLAPNRSPHRRPDTKTARR